MPETIEFILIIVQIAVAIAVVIQAYYTRRSVEEAKRSRSVQVLATLKIDSTAAMLSLRYTIWIFRGLAVQKKCYENLKSCSSLARSAISANPHCFSPAGILNDYTVTVSGGYPSIRVVLPSALEALAYISRIARDVAADNELASEAETLRVELEKLGEADCPRLNDLAEKLEKIVAKAEKTLNAPTSNSIFEACREGQKVPQCT